MKWIKCVSWKKYCTRNDCVLGSCLTRHIHIPATLYVYSLHTAHRRNTFKWKKLKLENDGIIFFRCFFMQTQKYFSRAISVSDSKWATAATCSSDAIPMDIFLSSFQFKNCAINCDSRENENQCIQGTFIQVFAGWSSSFTIKFIFSFSCQKKKTV